jgi:mannose-1-phosphate guanylyltransferase
MSPSDRSDPTDRADRIWTIVLAGGQGKRLARLTRAVYGHDVPKQFAALDSDLTFLQNTMMRSTRLVPAARSIVVVAEECCELAGKQLAPWKGTRVVGQPRDVGTLAGLLLPLAHVLHEDPEARIVVYPSDHHVERLAPFIAAVRNALEILETRPASIALVGARAQSAASDLGWILSGQTVARAPAVRAVESFIEKPSAPIAAQLFDVGALWNTLVFAAHGQHLWDAALEMHADLAAPFERFLASVGTPDEERVKREIYEALRVGDLSRDFLAAQKGLVVVEMGDAGWSDCGTPERLFECLERSREMGGLLRQLRTVEAG